MVKSPRQYPRRPVDNDFFNFMTDRLPDFDFSTESGMKQMENWWDREMDYQEHNDCPPWCTAFERHTHPGLGNE